MKKIITAGTLSVLISVWNISFVHAIHLTKNIHTYSFHERVDVFRDHSSRLNISDITSNTYADSFQLLNPQNRVMDSPFSTYWIRIPITNTNSPNQYWTIDFFDFRLSSISMFSDKNQELFKTGNYSPFKDRIFKHKNFVFPVIALEGKPSVYYFKIRVDRKSYVSGAVRTVEEFSGYANEEYFLLALFYGILVTMIAYNMMVYFSIRDSTYLYYVMYIVSIGLLTSTRDNIGYQYLWNDFPIINKYLFPVAELALICFAGLYAMHFLDLKKKEPFLYKLVFYTLIFRIGFFLAGCIVDSTIIYIYVYDLIPLFLLFIVGIKTKIDGYKPAEYYIAGFTFLLMAFIISICIDVNILPANVYTFYSLNAGIILESFFLSLAIGSKMRNVYKEKQVNDGLIIEQMEINKKLQTKVNRELEDKVKQRTVELESKTEELTNSNHKLKELTDQLNAINSRLDVDNWKLNQEVKEKMKEKITSKELNYEEFSSVFPDENSCMRYLEEIKWANGYQCAKCSNSKYSEGELKFSRKCTRCDYIETVKSHTIFQGIKFPLQKSFYILYLTTNSKRKVTLKELSDTLDLRMNTCSDFRKKIDKKKEKIKTDHWEELVLD